jgi:hypothetical protein
MLYQRIESGQRITIPELVVNLLVADKMMIVVKALPYFFSNMILGSSCIFPGAIDIIANRR